jgi:hypothetical protein
MLAAFRGMRSVTVQMNVAVDETGSAFRFPCHGLSWRQIDVAVLKSKDEAKENL